MTPAPRLVPQAGPAVWTGAALTPNDWMVPLGADAATELAAAVAALGDRRPERAEDASLPRLGALLRSVADRLEHGRGFVLLRGLTLERLGAPGGAVTAEAVLHVLAAHLGTLLPQDDGGTLIGGLIGPASSPTGQPSGPMRFHADPADAVALFCLWQPAMGGSVTLVSAPALHAPLPHGPSAPRPVFSIASGAFVGRYERNAMPDPLPNPAQAAAVAALDATAAAPGQALAIPLHAGDLLVYNPHLVWQRMMPGNRRVVPDAERELLRLWLATPNSRTLPESFRPVFGETAAGARRGGVLGAVRPGALRMVGG